MGFFFFGFIVALTTLFGFYLVLFLIWITFFGLLISKFSEEEDSEMLSIGFTTFLFLSYYYSFYIFSLSEDESLLLS
jgi:hypothetical protein